MNTVRINGQDYTSSLSDAEIAFMGNFSLPTTAQTLSGAIAEHETDISELNSNLTDFKNLFLKNIGDSSDTELNELTTPGIYYTWIKPGSTCPAKSQWSIVIVASPNANYYSQIVISTQTSLKIASRYFNNGTWTSWFTS